MGLVGAENYAISAFASQAQRSTSELHPDTLYSNNLNRKYLPFLYLRANQATCCFPKSDILYGACHSYLISQFVICVQQLLAITELFCAWEVSFPRNLTATLLYGEWPNHLSVFYLFLTRGFKIDTHSNSYAWADSTEDTGSLPEQAI